jgi:hypothetical protein
MDSPARCYWFCWYCRCSSCNRYFCYLPSWFTIYKLFFFWVFHTYVHTGASVDHSFSPFLFSVCREAPSQHAHRYTLTLPHTMLFVFSLFLSIFAPAISHHCVKSGAPSLIFLLLPKSGRALFSESTRYKVAAMSCVVSSVSHTHLQLSSTLFFFLLMFLWKMLPTLCCILT